MIKLGSFSADSTQHTCGLWVKESGKNLFQKKQVLLGTCDVAMATSIISEINSTEQYVLY
jgi:hypothetical protein